ncbi:N-acetylneuraminate 7-O(or 9-O)-acetyltransferase [Handroanthus impetiginosus]|uniref:N-acetylneuraminate 7-O(Or 9-O)-acetyltransferase n=1 Tax=Handroanthus impetiginosus TaxID=429701 RepID=A0A2G9FZN0_9LAMI|nr:N-acetylneuraminate 7-O(or 9-O)-acetyltransferase [Handroanthus impetiginosus]
MMSGAVQLGLLAACIVLFVPMGMAGWHLSRNKMLFFSCALFITLAVGVHLMPYLYSISVFLSPSEVISAPTSLYRDSCVFFLHSVMYKVDRECNSPFDNNGTVCKKSWEWIRSGRVAECEFQKLKKSDASDLLNGSWILVAGDSQARLMVVSLLKLVVGSDGMERIGVDLMKRHTDYSVMVEEIGMKLDFIWAPFVGNLTELMLQLKRNKNLPDVMVLGAGLWDMLHVNNVSEYGSSLHVLRDNVLALLPVSSNLDGGGGEVIESKSTRLLHLFWVGMPTLITSMLNTEEKRLRMNDVVLNSYDNEVTESKLLRQSGGPLLKLDIRLLSDLCGPHCTADGMHYDGVVYDTAIQIMLNALLIESNQKPQ